MDSSTRMGFDRNEVILTDNINMAAKIKTALIQ